MNKHSLIKFVTYLYILLCITQLSGCQVSTGNSTRYTGIKELYVIDVEVVSCMRTRYYITKLKDKHENLYSIKYHPGEHSSVKEGIFRGRIENIAREKLRNGDTDTPIVIDFDNKRVLNDKKESQTTEMKESELKGTIKAILMNKLNK